MPWTQEKVLAVAPDASSVAAGRKLATPGPWSSTGSTDSLLWGSCQGSGKKPYQVSIDLTGPAYRCSCPSRKFPCKHAIALLLLWSAGAIDGGEVADFAADWAAERSERAPRRTTPPDPEAQAARRAERIATMDAGVADLGQWLTDLARGGLSEALRRPTAWWEAAAARLVDGQLPGLAERIRDTGADAAHGLDATDLLHRVGVWWMLVQAWRRRDLLPSESVADLYAAVGLPTPTALVRDGERHTGVWTVMGAHRDEKGRLAQQRTWLRADDGETVMTLETAGPGQSLRVPQLAGARLAAEMALYPGHRPRRALFVDPPEALEPATTLGTGGSVDDALAAAAAALATVPWRDRHPVCIDDVAVAGDAFDHVTDSTGAALRLTHDTPTRALLAATGGHADQVFGELEGGMLRVLTVVEGGEVTVL